MKKSLILTSLLVGAIAFTGCGSDSDGGTKDGTENSGGGTGNNGSSSLSLTPVATKVVCDPKASTLADASYDVKYLANGDITVMCKTFGGYTSGEYQLATGVSTLTIVDVKKVEESSVNTVNLKGKSLDTYDYKAGTIHRQENGVAEGKTVKYDCVETYPSPLPATLTSTATIEMLLEWEPDENDRVKTTCPSSYYAENDSDDEDFTFGKGTVNVITNYTLTDSDAKKHLLTESIKMIFNK